MKTPDRCSFLPSLKKYLFSGELLLRQLSIQLIDKFLENHDQNSLDTKSFSAIFHKYLRLAIVLIIIKLELRIKAS